MWKGACWTRRAQVSIRLKGYQPEPFSCFNVKRKTRIHMLSTSKVPLSLDNNYHDQVENDLKPFHSSFGQPSLSSSDYSWASSTE